MAAYFRLQDLIAISATQKQQREFAIDVGNYRYLVLQFRITKPASASSTLQIEHAAVNEESAYVAKGNTVDLDAADNVVIELQDPLRFLRWSATLTGGTADFLIDVIARN